MPGEGKKKKKLNCSRSLKAALTQEVGQVSCVALNEDPLSNTQMPQTWEMNGKECPRGRSRNRKNKGQMHSPSERTTGGYAGGFYPFQRWRSCTLSLGCRLSQSCDRPMATEHLPIFLFLTVSVYVAILSLSHRVTLYVGVEEDYLSF